MNKIIWTFKDGCRRWWRVEAWDTGERTAIAEIPSDADWVWAYQIFGEHLSEPLYRGSVTGQYDNPPRLETLLLDWLGAVNAAIVDGCMHNQRQEITVAENNGMGEKHV